MFSQRRVPTATPPHRGIHPQRAVYLLPRSPTAARLSQALDRRATCRRPLLQPRLEAGHARENRRLGGVLEGSDRQQRQGVDGGCVTGDVTVGRVVSRETGDAADR